RRRRARCPPPPDIVTGRPLRSPLADESLQAFFSALAASLAPRSWPFLAAASAARSFFSMPSILPPAFSTASRADFDTPATLKLALALNSPLPSQRTPSLPPRARPAAFRAS